MKRSAAASIAAALALAGCGSPPPPPPAAPRTLAASAAPAEGVWVALRARGEHVAPVGHAPSMGWIAIARLADEGSRVRQGDELIRFVEDTLREDNARDAFALQQEDQNRRMDLMRLDGAAADLDGKLRQLAAQRAVLAAQVAAATVIDQEQVRIARLQLEDARAALAAATLRRTRLESLAAGSGAVAASELADARGDEIRARAAVAAPEAALELAQLPASSASVREMRLAVADLDAQIGSGAGEGLRADLATAAERRHRRELDQGQERRRRRVAARDAILADPVVRARADGTVAYRSDEVRVGSKQPGLASCIFVLGPDGMAARLEVPEAMRGLVADGARVAIAGVGGSDRPLLGTVATIAALPEDARDGRRVFAALVRFAAPPEGLEPGMRLAGRLLVALPGTPAVVPSYCVLPGERPEIILGDGRRREVTGWSHAGSFVALAGLAPGEVVQVPEQAPPAGRVRIAALVEPEESAPVRLRSWAWEPVELVPEGTLVKAGQRIARLAKTEFWRPPEDVRADAELSLAKARLDLVVGQLDAADDRARARADWARAILGRDRTRLQAWIARAAWDPVAEASADAAVAAAGIALERARRDLAATRAERAAGSASDVALRKAEVALAAAEDGSDRARLEAAAQELGKGWLDLRAKDDAARGAAEDEAAKRELLLIATEQYRSRLASAAANVENVRRGVEASLQSIADEEVLAPADGTLVYVRSWDGLPRIGQQLQTMEPFRIARGERRRATFDVPARMYGRFAAGDRVRLRGDAAGEQVEATVVKVAPAFLPPRDLADELALGRTVGQADRVFQITVAFAPPGGDPARLPPGATVQAEF